MKKFVYVKLIVLCFLVTNAYAIRHIMVDIIAMERPATANLVLHMPLDDGDAASTIEDLSAEANDGNPVGLSSSSNWGTGKIGKSIIGDGSNAHYVEVPHDSTLAPTDVISFGCWAYKSDWSVSPTAEEAMVSKRESGGWALFCRATSLIGFNVRDQAGSYMLYTTSHAGYSAGWHHFFVVFDGSNGYFYKDGVEVDHVAASSSTIYYNYSNSVLINAEAYTGTTPQVGGEGYFDGEVDEVRVYHDALTADEVYTLYKNPGGY